MPTVLLALFAGPDQRRRLMAIIGKRERQRYELEHGSVERNG